MLIKTLISQSSVEKLWTIGCVRYFSQARSYTAAAEAPLVLTLKSVEDHGKELGKDTASVQSRFKHDNTKRVFTCTSCNALRKERGGEERNEQSWGDTHSNFPDPRNCEATEICVWLLAMDEVHGESY